MIPLSFHVRHKVDHEGQAPNCEHFRILTQVWEDIQSAAREDDMDKMVDLTAADDIHPLLQPVTDQFRRCRSKAYVICSNPSREAQVGHYSLNLKSYTQASSPIWRYMDIILQRLLHSMICKRQVQCTPMEISSLCNQFEHNIENANKSEQKAEQISYAVGIKKSASKLGFVVGAEPDRDSFAVSFPFNKNIFTESLSIMYKDLQLLDQPFYDKASNCITLTWKKRIYVVDTMEISKELEIRDCGPCIELPLTVWKATIEATDEEKWDHCLIMAADTKQCTPEEKEISTVQRGHEVDMNLQLHTHQLVHIKPTFEICVEHVHSPITCFSRSADDPSRIQYSSTEEYVRIWKPLCEMESATNAVDESDSIIIENLVVDFSQEQEGTQTGSFFLPLKWIDEWAIECNLSRCFLCIRKRSLRLASTFEHSAVVDPKEFTWVAHGVTRNVERKKNPLNEGSKVEFYVSPVTCRWKPFLNVSFRKHFFHS